MPLEKEFRRQGNQPAMLVADDTTITDRLPITQAPVEIERSAEPRKGTAKRVVDLITIAICDQTADALYGSRMDIRIDPGMEATDPGRSGAAAICQPTLGFRRTHFPTTAVPPEARQRTPRPGPQRIGDRWLQQDCQFIIERCNGPQAISFDIRQCRFEPGAVEYLKAIDRFIKQPSCRSTFRGETVLEKRLDGKTYLRFRKNS
ncbi:MAG: hypothetical protein FIB06_07350 [Betaproteobacteria bacterium]|nr:hypothetical protein [Betaproteobacteria bacterium]